MRAVVLKEYAKVRYPFPFFDLLQIRGKYQTVRYVRGTLRHSDWPLPATAIPWVAGFEFAGVVSSISITGEVRFKTGERVFGASQGAYATSVCAKDSELQRVPDNWDFESAAGLYLTGPTSYAALKLRANVQRGRPCIFFHPFEVSSYLGTRSNGNKHAGDWVLVHGAAGGIGLSAIQIAKAFGAKVIASATTPSNIAACRSFGADFVIDYVATPKWELEVQRITQGHAWGGCCLRPCWTHQPESQMRRLAGASGDHRICKWEHWSSGDESCAFEKCQYRGCPLGSLRHTWARGHSLCLEWVVCVDWQRLISRDVVSAWWYSSPTFSGSRRYTTSFTLPREKGDLGQGGYHVVDKSQDRVSCRCKRFA